MHMFGAPGECLFVLLTAGSLSTTQAVVNTIKRDLENPSAELSLDTVEYVFDAAHNIGAISYRVQQERAEALKPRGASAEATFLLGGQLRGQPHALYLIYPPGNYIAASPEPPNLQIGESQYGTPILESINAADASMEDE